MSMPTSKEKKSFQRARVPELVGAGGEPPGEPPAPPPGLASSVGALSGDRVAAMLERPALSEELVEDAIDRARLRGALELPDGGEIPDAVIDQLLAGARTEEEIAGPGGVLAQLTKRLIERALEVELTDHLGYEPHAEPPGGAGNRAICRARHIALYVAPGNMLRCRAGACGSVEIGLVGATYFVGLEALEERE